MFTVTFYSYKGGVGRTLALMNTAYRLSQQDKSVFILDFDLEAPGIDVFAGQNEDPRPGLLEYIDSYSSNGFVAPLEQFVSKLTWKSGAAVNFMSAGRRTQSYQTMLARLNWKQLYASAHGYLFVENLKAAIKEVYSPDYILVDSRTGFTDVSGICTLQLPDLVVLIFGLNDQNLIGTSHIYKSIKQNSLNRQIDTLLVASPVPDVPAFVTIKQDRLLRAKELLEAEPDLILPFNAFVAFKETTEPTEIGEFLNAAYKKLTQEIVLRNKFDLDTMLRDARKFRNAGDFETGIASYRQILSIHKDKPAAWLDYGKFLRFSGHNEKALEAFESARTLQPSARVFQELAITHLSIKQFEEAHYYLLRFLDASNNAERIKDLGMLFEAREKPQSALQAYLRILQLPNPDLQSYVAAGVFAGNLFLRLGQPDKAVDCFLRSLGKSPQLLAANYNLAVAYERQGLLSEAGPYFQKAISIAERQPIIITLPRDLANRLQALAHAHQFVGNRTRAIELLSQSLQAAEKVETNIFSSIQYREISRQDFILETKSILDTLVKNREST